MSDEIYFNKDELKRSIKRFRQMEEDLKSILRNTNHTEGMLYGVTEVSTYSARNRIGELSNKGRETIKLMDELIWDMENAIKTMEETEEKIKKNIIKMPKYSSQFKISSTVSNLKRKTVSKISFFKNIGKGKNVSIKGVRALSKISSQEKNKLVKDVGKAKKINVYNEVKSSFSSSSTNILKKGASTVSAFSKEFEKGGTLYKPLKVGNAFVTLSVGVVVITGSGVAEIFSGGTVTPIAYVTAGFGANSVFNGGRDLYYCATGNWEKAGQKDLFRDVESLTIGLLGKPIGHEKEGKIVGETLYYSEDLFTSLNGIAKAFNTIKAGDYIKTCNTKYLSGNWLEGFKDISVQLEIKGPPTTAKAISSTKLVSTIIKYFKRVETIYEEATE